MIAGLIEGPFSQRVFDLVDNALDDESLKFARFEVEGAADGLLDVVLLLGCSCHGVFESRHPMSDIDVLLVRNLA